MTRPNPHTSRRASFGVEGTGASVEQSRRTFFINEGV
jgi:hypothetical protein